MKPKPTAHKNAHDPMNVIRHIGIVDIVKMDESKEYGNRGASMSFRMDDS